MMMSKPAQGKEEEPAVPAFATRAPAVSAVQDLERRLAMLGGEEAAPAPLVDLQPPPPPVAVAPVAQVGTTTEKKPAAVKGGKNALLVRFFVRQNVLQFSEKAKASNPINFWRLN